MRRLKFPADKPRSYVDIEWEAKKARKLLEFDLEEPLQSMQLLERIGRMRAGPSLEITVGYGVCDLLDGVEAETRFDPDRRIMEVILSAETYGRLEQDNPRCRLTVAHEIGHVSQHYAEVMRLSRIPDTTAALLRGRFSDLPAYRDVEWQADAFGGAFLVPARALWKMEINGRLTLEAVRRRFGVSPSAAATRISKYEKNKELLVK